MPLPKDIGWKTGFSSSKRTAALLPDPTNVLPFSLQLRFFLPDSPGSLKFEGIRQ